MLGRGGLTIPPAAAVGGARPARPGGSASARAASHESLARVSDTGDPGARQSRCPEATVRPRRQRSKFQNV